VPLVETQQQCRDLVVHCDPAIAASKNTAQDALLKIIRKTGRSNNSHQHPIGYEKLYIDVEGGQQTM
jgi:hypothetical protein